MLYPDLEYSAAASRYRSSARYELAYSILAELELREVK